MHENPSQYLPAPTDHLIATPKAPRPPQQSWATTTPKCATRAHNSAAKTSIGAGACGHQSDGAYLRVRQGPAASWSGCLWSRAQLVTPTNAGADRKALYPLYSAVQVPQCTGRRLPCSMVRLLSSAIARAPHAGLGAVLGGASAAFPATTPWDRRQRRPLIKHRKARRLDGDPADGGPACAPPFTGDASRGARVVGTREGAALLLLAPLALSPLPPVPSVC